jgi:hypothetical protein
VRMEREREREREKRERETDRETERQRDRETERERRGRDRETKRDAAKICRARGARGNIIYIIVKMRTSVGDSHRRRAMSTRRREMSTPATSTPYWCVCVRARASSAPPRTVPRRARLCRPVRALDGPVAVSTSTPCT